MNKRGKKRVVFFLLFLAVLAAAAAVSIQLEGRQQKKTVAETENYKTETVRRGTVSTGISESGSVSFGTLEQEFSVAKITDGTVSDSDTDSGSGSENTMTGGQSMPGGGDMAPSQENMISATSTESTGESTSLTVEEVYLASGQVVQKGDKILKISEDSIEEYRTQLEAAVKSAQLQVTQEEINAESKKAEADYTYAMYLARGETAEATYEATITSLETAVSDLEEELEEADEDDVEELEAQLQIARNNLATKSIEAKQTYDNAMTNYNYAQQLYEIDTNGLEDDLNDAKDVLAQAEENLADFEEQIGDGIIYAEISGTVMDISCAEGDTLLNDSVLLTLADHENVTMTVSVSQEDISKIAVGDEAQITLTAYEKESFDGVVTGISVSTENGSSTVNYDVTVQFTGDTDKVYSGMTGEAVFTGKSVADTLYISNRAVYQQGPRSYVKVLDSDGEIRETEIETGFSNGSIVAVESGLEEGQTVVIESKVVS